MKVKPIAQGCRYYHYQEEIERLGRVQASKTPSESGCSWWLFRNVSEPALKRWMQENNIAYRPVDAAHDCSGQTGTRRPQIKRTKARVLVTQGFYTDI